MHATQIGPQRLLEEPVFQVLKKAFRSMRFGLVGVHLIHLEYSDARGGPFPLAKRQNCSSQIVGLLGGVTMRLPLNAGPTRSL